MTATNGEVTQCSPQGPTQRFSSPYSLSQLHIHHHSSVSENQAAKKISEVSLFTSLSEFSHAKKRFLSLQTLTIPLFPFSRCWHLQSSTGSALRLLTADVAHLPMDQGSLCRDPRAWNTERQPGRICHILPTISFLMFTLPKPRSKVKSGV